MNTNIKNSWDNDTYNSCIPSANVKLTTDNLAFSNAYQIKSPSTGGYSNCDNRSCRGFKYPPDPVCQNSIQLDFFETSTVSGPVGTTNSCAPCFDGGQCSEGPVYQCINTKNYTCGNIDPINTCMIGTAGTVQNTSPIKGTDWDLTTYPGGWIYCNYTPDFTNFNFNETQSIFKFITDILTSENSSTGPSGMSDDVKNNLTITTTFYAIITDYYNQLYF